jgi:3'(2'), 5'-bisphosphate nucleotidase
VIVTQAVLETLCDIAVRAGEVVMEIYGGDLTHWTKPDSSPLTEADVRADAVIRSSLNRAFPGVTVISEETPSAGNAMTDTFFLVDPLDGTKEFISRTGEFTINVAVISRGEPVGGVVYAPATDDMFFATAVSGAFKRSAGRVVSLRVKTFDGDRPLRVIGSRSHGGPMLQAWLDALPGEHTFVASGSSLKFCAIAEGKADIYPRFGLTSQWDTAAAQCVLEQAGGVMLAMDRSRLRYGTDCPMLNPFFAAAGDRRLLDLVPVVASNHEPPTTNH